MSAYDTLAFSYDGLTTDVAYAAILDYLETLLTQRGHRPTSAVDLGCGTGSMTVLLAQRGYRTLGVDISEEMLTVAAQKSAGMEDPPYFVHQPMQRLRLPMPADMVVCLLDSLNYVTKPEDCQQTFRRVYQALNPGGVFFFDINTVEKLRGLDGQVFLDENDESYCVWRVDYDEAERLCYYGIDLFRRRGTLWERSFEQHTEYAYTTHELMQWLREAGFTKIELFGDQKQEAPAADEQRIYFLAVKE